MLYVTSSSTRDYIPFQQIQMITNSEAEITGLYPGNSYEVFVAALTDSSGTNRIIIPSTSQVQNIPICKYIMCNIMLWVGDTYFITFISSM